jgi:hypothetical protein
MEKVSQDSLACGKQDRLPREKQGKVSAVRTVREEVTAGSSRAEEL